MNKFIKPILTTALLGLFAAANSALAEDTDIYMANTDVLNNPNIMVLLDNSSNWARNDQGWPVGKQGEAELRALSSAASTLTDKTNLGLMMFGTGAIDGAYVRWAMRPMSGTTTTGNKYQFMRLIGTTPVPCVDSTNGNLTPNCILKNFSSGPKNESVNAASINYSAALFDVFKYFGGHTTPAKAFDPNPNGSTPIDSTHFGTERYATLDARHDPAAYSADKLSYRSPLSETSRCAKNYLIVIGNGYPNADSPASLLTGVGGDATPLAAQDFTTVDGDVDTLLGQSLSYPSQAACEADAPNLAAAQGYTFSTPDPLPYPGFKPYRCDLVSSGTITTPLGTSSCGQYTSATDCFNSASTDYPGHSGYSCTQATSCTGSHSLGASACYASQAACTAAVASLYPAFSSVSCAATPTACAPVTDLLNSGTGDFAAGKFATKAACEAGAAAMTWPKIYNSFTCTQQGAAVPTTMPQSSCYASNAACTTAEKLKYPGYSAVACGATATACAAKRADVCATNSAYNTAAKCNTAAPTLLGGTYGTYVCTDNGTTIPANWAGTGANATCATRYWFIEGFNNNSFSYPVSGTGYAWKVEGTISAGNSYDIIGTGGSTYTTSYSTTNSLWNSNGVVNMITSVPLPTFSAPSPRTADEWASFLEQTDVSAASGQQNIVTYTIDVFKDHQDTDQTRLMMNMARVGGGKYFAATDENAIKDALNQIFAEIQSVNSVFASSSLPVSVNTQGTYLNQVFMGMFRPNSSAKPRWLGNLKQYQFKEFAGTLRLADKLGAEAISATTGFIAPCADSFWSADTGRYWNYSGSAARGNCNAKTSNGPVPGSLSYFSDSPDGDIVEKGGVAHRMRGVTLSGGRPVVSTNYTTRNLLTCDGSSTSSCTSFTAFATSNPALTPAVFGTSADPVSTQNAFIDWVRGKDAANERISTALNDSQYSTLNTAGAGTNEVRPSVHGGVVHSQPAVVDYGGATGVVAFYGSDDGVFHAIDGGQTDAEGTEMWGFIAPELHKQLRRQLTNLPLVDLPGVTVSTARPKDYGFDGGIGVHQRSGITWIFPSMRRGGRSIYAFDVSTPSSPSIKWRKGCFTNNTQLTGGTYCTAGWDAIGQTWSKPTVAYLPGYVGGDGLPKPVLIFGGGYDTCEDYNGPTDATGARVQYDGSTPYNQTPASATCNAATVRKGANIWFVDADTGNIIRTYPAHYSVPGDLTLLTDAVGNVTHVYATDTGGYVYRINVGRYDGSSFAGAWSSNSSAADTVIASLNEAGTNRKFLFGPAVVKYSGFNAVLVGSGDREHPLINDYACGGSSITAPTVQNRYYMLLDRPNAYSGSPISNAGLLDVTTSVTTTFDTATGTFTSNSGATSTLGWFFNFGRCEQAVNKGLVIAGTAYFGTNAPATSTSACETNLGVARGYAVDFLTGNAENTNRSAVYTGGGMPPSPVAGVVDIDGNKQPFCIGCIDTTAASSSALQGSPVTINPSSRRIRSYWYIEND